MLKLPAALLVAFALVVGQPSSGYAVSDRTTTRAPENSGQVLPVAARVSVLVLANGGKFVGDDIGGALVTIRDAYTKDVLASGRTVGGSGLADLVTIDLDLLQTIPETEAARFVAMVPVEEPRPVEVTAHGPLAAQGSAVQASTMVWLLPPSLAENNRVVITLRGLVVQLLEPPTHYLPTTPAPRAIPIRANVTMICGCPIGPSFPWKPEDYQVQAVIRTANGVQAIVPLAFAIDAPDGIPSQFIGSWNAPAAGVYEITVVAHQLTHDNVGVAKGTFILK